MINKSIAYRLSIFISIAVISVFIAFILIAYLYNQRLLKDNIEHRAIGISTEITMDVEKLVISTREISSNISDQVLYYGQHNNIDIFIKGILNRYPGINAIHININNIISDQIYHNYLGYRENDSIFVKKQNTATYHCEKEAVISERIIRNKTYGWSDPYRCPKNNDIVVSYYSPIKIVRNNEEIIVGEVICELSLLKLNDIINSVKIDKRGFAFLISKNGDFITHPNEDWILNHNIFTISDKIYDRKKIDVKQKIDSQISGITIAHPEWFEYEKSWVYYSPIKENGWSLILTIPYSDLFEPLYRMLLKMLFFSVLGILAIFITVTFITNKLIEPLSTVTSQLKKFSNLSGEAAKTQNEIKVVSESLNSLQAWYEKYKDTQNQEKKSSSRYMQDLVQASEIQQSLIKNKYPAFPGRNDIDLFVMYKPASVVSGDLFDYFFIDDDHIVLTIGDVSGKGFPAAFFMSMAQTIIKNCSTTTLAKNIVSKVNKDLYTNNQHQFFLTLFLGVLNIQTGTLNYCNAAHTSTLVLKENGKITELGQSHGLPLGLYPDKEYSDSNIKIEKGDTLILYSDGITEIQDSNKIIFGVERFKENVAQLLNKSPKDMVSRIEKSLEIFKGEAKQSDDISLLIFRYNP